LGETLLATEEYYSRTFDLGKFGDDDQVGRSVETRSGLSKMAKEILIAGGSGLVGFAVLKLFSSLPDWEPLVLSRRRPPALFNARFIPADLMDESACAELADQLRGVTHVVYTALHERPELIAGWRHETQIRANDRMLRNLFVAIGGAAPNLEHVTLMQGTKAYGVHVRPIAIPARENRDEMHEEPNFYWLQEKFLKEKQRNENWHWTILRPQIIFGESFGSPMNLIPAIGVYGSLLKEDGLPLMYPGGAPSLTEAVDADLLAHAIAWAAQAPAARNQIFNVTNGDVLSWRSVWPAIADALGMQPGGDAPLSLASEMPKRAEDWERIRAKYRLVSPSLEAFVGLSFQYADSCLAHGDERHREPAVLSTIKLRQAGFHEFIDTEVMLRKWFHVFREKRYLPPL
jgi:nucleoside-diphosphate-sugar epimerase